MSLSKFKPVLCPYVASSKAHVAVTLSWASIRSKPASQHHQTWLRCVCRAATRHRGSSLRPRSSQQLQPAPTVPPAVPPTDPVTTVLPLPHADFAPLGILATPQWPPGVQAGQPFTLTLELRNEGKAPQSLLVAIGDASGFVVAGKSTACSRAICQQQALWSSQNSERSPKAFLMSRPQDAEKVLTGSVHYGSMGASRSAAQGSQSCPAGSARRDEAQVSDARRR